MTLCPRCTQPMCGVQYCLSPCDYDGVSEWHCEPCNLRVGRWSGLTLGEGELEGRWGIGSPYKTGFDAAPRTDVRSEQAFGGQPESRDEQKSALKQSEE